MPSAGITNSYSGYTIIPEFAESGRVTDSNVGVYTCPGGFVAKVSGTMVLDALGAKSSYAIAIKRSGSGDFFPVGAYVEVKEVSVIPTYVILHSNDILTMIGNGDGTGLRTNGTGDLNIMVQEVGL